MELSYRGLLDPTPWTAKGITLPKYDAATMAEKTRSAPIWVHFGSGNIFRGFIAQLQQTLLNAGLAEKGIIAVDTFDFDIIDKIYTPYDNLTMNVTLNPDATVSCEVMSAVAEGLKADARDDGQMARLRRIFSDPGLQLVSFTITEKGYALHRADGSLQPVAAADFENGPSSCFHAMSILTALLLHRYQTGAAPLAVVSMDNCSRNGEKLFSSVMEVAKAWEARGFADAGFLSYLSDPSRVSFPWSMIDKITPRPSNTVQRMLESMGLENMTPIVTSKNTFIAPFVNAERPQYLVVEDNFPNGRPPLEKAGVIFGDRDTVNKSEAMKVMTCLNPLHTAMSVYGCMLGYTLICEEMKDPDIVKLIQILGYQEGLPVVVDPGILSPKAFLDEVVTERLPNPFMPDSPQRIATDTSQKVSIRFGETLKHYLDAGKSLSSLTAIPLALAGWLRYLLGVDDQLQPMEVSPDPMKEELQAELSGIQAGHPESYHGQLRNILSNQVIFGLDLVQAGLADKIEEIFLAELAGAGAVRATLKKYLSPEQA